MVRDTRPVSWIGAARKAFEAFPQSAQVEAAQALTVIAAGGMPDVAKPLKGLGAGVVELGSAPPRRRLLGDARTAETDQGGAMSDDADEGGLEAVRGSGNVFRDLGLPNPDLEQLRTILAARIVRVLDEEGLTMRRAQELTGFATADFSRLRRAKLGRFTVDRLMAMLDRLGQEVELSVTVHPRLAPSRR